jgi:hypothetical protein
MLLALFNYVSGLLFALKVRYEVVIDISHYN